MLQPRLRLALTRAINGSGLKRAVRAFLDPRLPARTTRRLERPQIIWAQAGAINTSKTRKD